MQAITIFVIKIWRVWTRGYATCSNIMKKLLPEYDTLKMTTIFLRMTVTIQKTGKNIVCRVNFKQIVVLEETRLQKIRYTRFVFCES